MAEGEVKMAEVWETSQPVKANNTGETSLPSRICKQVSEQQRKLLPSTTLFPFTQFAAKQTKKNTTLFWKSNQM